MAKPQRTDLTQYSDAELSLRIFNDELWHSVRHSALIFKLIDQSFVYTPAQIEHTKYMLDADLANQEVASC